MFESVKISIILFALLCLVDFSKGNTNHSVEIPLVSKLNAPLKAEMDISELTSQLKNIIEVKIKERVQSAITESVSDLISERFQKVQKFLNDTVGDSFVEYTEDRVVAFFATLTKTTALTKNKILRLDNVQTNIGRGYNPESGKFTAFKPGVYSFMASLVSNGEQWLELNLIKNDEFIVRVHCAYLHGTSGSLYAILELKKGDTVFLRNPRTYGTVIGSKYSMFAGHLL